MSYISAYPQFTSVRCHYTQKNTTNNSTLSFRSATLRYLVLTPSKKKKLTQPSPYPTLYPTKFNYPPSF